MECLPYHIIYASFLWSLSNNNSSELFAQFWYASKRCHSLDALGYFYILPALGYWDDRSSVLGADFFPSYSPQHRIKLPNTSIPTSTQTLFSRYIISHILNTLLLKGAFIHNRKHLFVVALGILHSTSGEKNVYCIKNFFFFFFTGRQALRPL